LRINLVSTFHPALAMRAVLVAGLAAALALLALANIPISGPPIATIAKAPSPRAHIAASVAPDPLAFAGP
jgi:hypothetical protein